MSSTADHPGKIQDSINSPAKTSAAKSQRGLKRTHESQTCNDSVKHSKVAEAASGDQAQQSQGTVYVTASLT